MLERKIQAMHKRFGTCGAMRCKECSHLIGGAYHGRSYYKCELYGISRSEATDWRISNQACGMFNMEVDMDRWQPILKQILWQDMKTEQPLEGQLNWEDMI